MQMLDGQKTEQPKFELTTSRQFRSWLIATGARHAITTYQSGKVIRLDGGASPCDGANMLPDCKDIAAEVAVAVGIDQWYIGQ